MDGNSLTAWVIYSLQISLAVYRPAKFPISFSRWSLARQRVGLTLVFVQRGNAVVDGYADSS